MNAIRIIRRLTGAPAGLVGAWLGLAVAAPALLTLWPLAKRSRGGQASVARLLWRRLERRTHATWHAVDRSTRRLVANCSIFAIGRDHVTTKIGYRVAPWQRRRGVGSKVVALLTWWSLAELGLVRIQLEHAVANVGSCRVAAKAGFVLEGVLRSASRDGLGTRHDDHVPGRLATDSMPGFGATTADP